MQAIKKIVILAAVAYLAGCASGAKMEGMVPSKSQQQYESALKANVEVASVSGGEKTNPAWTSEIGGDEFKGALEEGLKAQGLLATSGKYKLKVEMVKVDQPMIGLDLTVTTHVKYTLTDSASGAKVFEETIVAPHTATFGDSAMAVKRLRLANEGSGKKNIDLFLDKLAALKIKKEQVSLNN
jgi:hypothetical protein